MASSDFPVRGGESRSFSPTFICVLPLPTSRSLVTPTHICMRSFLSKKLFLTRAFGFYPFSNKRSCPRSPRQQTGPAFPAALAPSEIHFSAATASSQKRLLPDRSLAVSFRTFCSLKMPLHSLKPRMRAASGVRPGEPVFPTLVCRHRSPSYYFEI